MLTCFLEHWRNGLHLLTHLRGAIDWPLLVKKKCEHKLSRNEAQRMTVREFLRDNDDENGADKATFMQFKQAWNACRDAGLMKEFECQTIHERPEMSEDLPLSFSCFCFLRSFNN